MAAGFAVIVTRRPLLRATVTSAVSYAGIGMLLVCCPVLGAERLGAAARGALLISAMAAASLAANALLARRAGRDSVSQGGVSQGGVGRADTLVLGSTLVMGISMAAAAVAPGWLTLAAVALTGAGEGPQLTALFAIRHRETPARMRGQVYTTAASLKIAGLAAGAALGGPLAGHSVTTCLLVAAGIELLAAASGLLAGTSRDGGHPARPATTRRATTRRATTPCRGGRRALVPRRTARPVRPNDLWFLIWWRHAVHDADVAGRLGRSHPAFRPSGWTAFFVLSSGPREDDNNDNDYGPNDDGSAAF
jgi:hypothetical protein